jgi:hypothetical protein
MTTGVPQVEVEEEAVGPRSPSLSKELALVGVGLLGVGLLVVAPHVRHGGFYSDDWTNAWFYRAHGYRYMAVHAVFPRRPVLAFLLPLPHALFGLDPSSHLAAAVALAAVASLSFFAFLRALGVEFIHALPLAFLALLFPWSDGLLLWATGSINNVALIAYFLGTVTALRGLGLTGDHRRRRTVLHGLSAVLYVVSVLTYEVAAAAILLSGLLYRARFSWRALRKRWLLDAALVLVPLGALVIPASHVRVGSLGERAADVPQFVIQGSSVFASTFLPPNTSASALKLLVLATTSTILGVALWRARRREERELRRWLLRAAAGASAVGLGYLMFLGYGLYPLSEGLDDRANTFAAFGFVVVTYSVVALLSVLLARQPGPRAAAILAAGTLLVGLGFVLRVRDDIERYDAATAQQNDELAKLRAAVPRPPQESTIFTFGYPTASAPGLPIFGAPWDLSGAVRLLWNDPSLTAVPVDGKSVSCGRNQARVTAYDPQQAAAYGHAIFVDLSTANVRHIASRRDCLQAQRAFMSAAWR